MSRRTTDQRPLLPTGFGVLALVALALVILPLGGLLARVEWDQLGTQLADPLVTQALRLSLATSVGALALSTVLGVPLAWVLARRTFRGLRLLRALAVLPMVLPPVVAGVAMLLVFGRRGIIGQPLHAATGFALPFTTAGVVLVQTFVSMPFLVVAVESGLRGLDHRLEDAAATLGASRWTVVRTVTLPLLGPSLAAGMALSWARALGEFGATITFAGNLPGRTQTMPLAVYLALESNPSAAYVLSFLLLAISVVILVWLRDRYLR